MKNNTKAEIQNIYSIQVTQKQVTHCFVRITQQHGDQF